MINLKKAFFFSILLHLSLVIGVHGCGGGKGDKTGNDGSNENIVVDSRTNYDGSPLNTYAKEPKQKKQPKKNCKNFYGGLGFVYQPFDDFDPKDPDKIVIREVPEGYPAYKAGLRTGDRVYYHGDLRGEVGSSVTFEVSRGSSSDRETMTLVREKICVEPEKKP